MPDRVVPSWCYVPVRSELIRDYRKIWIFLALAAVLTLAGGGWPALSYATETVSPQTDPIAIQDHSYRALVGKNEGYVLESDPDGEKRFPIAQVLSGKNVYYFLTMLDKGRLSPGAGNPYAAVG